MDALTKQKPAVIKRGEQLERDTKKMHRVLKHVLSLSRALIKKGRDILENVKRGTEGQRHYVFDRSEAWESLAKKIEELIIELQKLLQLIRGESSNK